MATEVKPISDAEFVKQFENQTLNPDYFSHLGHLRLAWLYLQRYDLETAITTISTGLQTYAESLEVYDKFHVTITDAIMRIISKRIEGMEEKTWQLFLEVNSDLVDDALSVLYQYFSKDRLLSDEARLSLIKPDLKEI